MRQVFENNKTLAGFFFVLGLCTFWAGQKVYQYWWVPKPAPRSQAQFPFQDLTIDDPFFNEDEEDPFESMRKMQHQMALRLGQHSNQGVGQVEQREDESFIYYDIQMQGVDQDKLKVNIENNQITISGEVKKEADGSSGSAAYFSKFQRTFPVPAGADAEKVQVENSKDQVTLKFPKIR